MQRLLADQVGALEGFLRGSGGQVVGPVGIVQQGEQLAAQEGALGLLVFFVSVNLNLALLNALPIPALDGGKIAFVLAEQAFGRRPDDDAKQNVELLFILLVVAALLNLTVKDVASLFEK